MGKAAHNDNDIVPTKRNNNDNDIVASAKYIREDVLGEISECTLNNIQTFLFGMNKNFGSCKDFVNPAIKQVERFTYIWLNELSESTRKCIINFTLGHDGDCRVRDYSDYTNSPVWKYISGVIKVLKGYTCEKCGKKYQPAHLVIHHCSYKHLGSEIYHLEDVQLLCIDCHLKTHGIGGKNECK